MDEPGSLDLQVALAVRVNTLAERAQELMDAIEGQAGLSERFAPELRSVHEALVDLRDVITLAEERRADPPP